MKNSGKLFESDFQKSAPSYCFVHRLKDSAQSYKKSKTTSFTWDNPCDFFLYDSKSHLLYPVECKTTKYKSMSVQLNKDDSKSSMVKHHQIESLREMSKYDGIVAGFFFNFRHFDGEENAFETTYFQGIEDFDSMMENIDKKSFNELDLLTNNAIKVSGAKKRTRYLWDIDGFLKSMRN